MANGNITVGTMAIAKVGRNAIEVEVIAQTDGSAFLVRNSAGKEFKAHRLEPMPVPAEISPVKRLSLMEAAIRVLQSQPEGAALNTRELVAMATEQGLWTPSGAKTPKQTLYGAIFREIATKENPRIVKADLKGKFRLA
ncbi:hypothetical protein SDC9_85837 [bioreactor metagenome]|uniref:HTH HARE-type domain-containing protein n=1 Tax=bioreactor metagenome TaxID=1076179 RepID=A0A644ZN99_9ZZZZ